MSCKSLTGLGIAGLVVGGIASAQSPKWHHVHGCIINDVTFFDDEVGVTAEDGGRIRRTEDGGDDWEFAEVPETVRVDLFGVHFVTGSIVYACGDDGVILKSTNGGHDWVDTNESSRITDARDECGSQLAKLQDIFMYQVEDAMYGFVVGYDGAIAYTTNDWTSWSRPTMPEIFDCTEGDPLDMYDIHIFKESGADEWKWGVIAGDYGYYLDTDDYGASWEMHAVGPEVECPSLAGRLELWAFTFEDPLDYHSDWWLAGGGGTGNGYVFATADQGTTWDQSYVYDALDPEAMVSTMSCGPATIYGITTLGTSPA